MGDLLGPPAAQRFGAFESSNSNNSNSSMHALAFAAKAADAGDLLGPQTTPSLPQPPMGPPKGLKKGGPSIGVPQQLGTAQIGGPQASADLLEFATALVQQALGEGAPLQRQQQQQQQQQQHLQQQQQQFQQISQPAMAQTSSQVISSNVPRDREIRV